MWWPLAKVLTGNHVLVLSGFSPSWSLPPCPSNQDKHCTGWDLLASLGLGITIRMGKIGNPEHVSTAKFNNNENEILVFQNLQKRRRWEMSFLFKGRLLCPRSFYDLSGGRERGHLPPFFTHSIPPAFKHGDSPHGFPSCMGIYHSKEKFEIQKMVLPASPESQEGSFLFCPSFSHLSC